MKKLLLVLLLTLLTTTVFAQRSPIRTSEGTFYVAFQYMGQYIGQQEYDDNVRAARSLYALGFGGQITENIKLTNGQLEAVNTILNRYQSSRGDTYFINIGLDQNLTAIIYVFVEFISNTQYNFWAYRRWS